MICRKLLQKKLGTPALAHVRQTTINHASEREAGANVPGKHIFGTNM